MATHVRHPILIAEAPRTPGAWTFGLLFFLESVARASLVTVLPLTAYGLFHSKEAVSLVYTGVSLATLAFTFAIPALVRHLSRRWAYSLGCALLGLFAVLLALGAPVALVAAMLCRTAGQALLNVTLSLYIMDHIGKRELTPLRAAAAGDGDARLGGRALRRGAADARPSASGRPAALSLAATATLAAVFWTLRLAEGGPIRAAAPRRRRREHPLAAVRRFAAQPRLRLAWMIAFARSCFWMSFFVYVPILVVEGGLDPATGGLAVAAGNLMLLNNIIARGWAARHSLRRVLAGAFLAAAALTLIAAAFGDGRPALAAATMVGGRLLRRDDRRARAGAVPARRPGPRAAADDGGLPDLPRRLGAAAAARLLLPVPARRLRRGLRGAGGAARRRRLVDTAPPSARDVAGSGGERCTTISRIFTSASASRAGPTP